MDGRTLYTWPIITTCLLPFAATRRAGSAIASTVPLDAAFVKTRIQPGHRTGR